MSAVTPPSNSLGGRLAAAEIEALRSLIRAAVEIEVLDDLGWRGRGVSMSLLPGEWDGVIARAIESDKSSQK